MEPFRVLAGLPGTGPWPEQFSTTGRGTHREGFVVEFNTDTDSAWVGNFQRGWTSYEAVFLHPDDQSVIVIAGGQGYVVDLKDRRAVGILSDQLESAIVLPDLKAVVLNNGIRLEAYGKAGLLWRTPRISWDGIWDFREEAGALVGMAWDAMSDIGVPFSVDAETGAVTGGVRPEPPGW